MKPTAKIIISFTIILGLTGQIGALVNSFLGEGINSTLENLLRLEFYVPFFLCGLLGSFVGFVINFQDKNHQKSSETVQLLRTNDDNRKSVDKEFIKISSIKDEEKYQSFYNRIPIGLYRTSPEGNILDANPHLLRMLGFGSLEEARKMNIEKDMVRYSPSYSRAQFKDILETDGSILGLESKWKTKDGSMIFVRENVFAFYDDQGILHYYEGSVEDITGFIRIEETLKTYQKQTETALIEAKDKYQTLIEKMDEGILVEDTKGIIKFVNPKYLDMTGYTEEELYGKHWSFVIPPKMHEEISNESEKRSKGISSTYETSIIGKNGNVIPVKNTASPLFSKDDEFEGVLSVITDITYQKQTEAALIETKNKYQTLIEKMQEGIFVENAEGIITFLNPVYEIMSGYTKEELYGQHWSFVIPPKFRQKVENETQKRSSGISNTYESYIGKKDGTVVPIIITACPLFSKNNEFEGTLSVITDITYQKETETALIQAKEKYQTLIEKMDEGLFVEDVEGHIIFTNPKYLEMCGYSKDEIIGKHWSFTVPPEFINVATTETSKRSTGYSTYESAILRKNGSSIPVKITATPLFSNNGEYEGVLVVFTDLSLQKQAEAALRQSKELYQMLIEKMDDGVALEDTEGRLIFINPKFKKLLGYKENEIIGRHWDNFVSPESLKKVENETSKRKKGESSTYEASIISKQGIQVSLIITATPLFSDDGVFNGILGLFRDTTESKKVQESLKESEKRYRTLFEGVPIGLYRSTPDGRFLAVNRAFGKMFGRTVEELYSIDIENEETRHGYDRNSFKELVENIGGIKGLEGRHENPDGSVFYYRENSVAVKDENGSILYFEGSFEDITERKILEEALKETEERYRTLFEGIPIGLYRSTPDGKFLAANRAFCIMMGKSFEELSLMNAETIAPTKDYPRNLFLELMETKGEVIGLEGRHKKPDGTFFHFRENSKAFKDENGLILYYEGSLEDITDRKILEEALIDARDNLAMKVDERTHELLEAKEKIETILKTVPVGILVLEPSGDLTLANKTFEDLYLRIFESRIPSTFNIFDQPDHTLFNEIRSAIASIEMSPKTIEPLKGVYLQILSRIMTIPGEEPFGVLIEFYDVTSFVEFEIIQKQFIAAVSHELRTPITILDLSIKNLEKYWGKLSETRKEDVFNLIIKSSFSLKQIIEDILIISKIETREFELIKSDFYIIDVLKDIVGQFDSRLREFKVTVQLDLDPKLEFYGDPKRLGKIISILLDNSIKFSPNKGSVIKISAYENNQGEYNPYNSDGILIQVTDTGRGISEKDLPNLFDRFFRSIDVKDVPGIGIGLFIAKILVDQHQGKIFVKSKLGEGTTFFIFLPRLKNHLEIDNY